jgi:hypothetical protein
MSAAVIEGNDAVTGHIISTTIGGKNGEPKQVGFCCLLNLCNDLNHSYCSSTLPCIRLPKVWINL